jgi:integrase
MVPRSVQRVRCGESATSPKTEIQPLDAEQVKRLLNTAKDTQPELYAIYTLAVTTGMRSGELLGLQPAWLAWSLAALFVAMFVASLTLYVLARSAISK